MLIHVVNQRHFYHSVIGVIISSLGIITLRAREAVVQTNVFLWRVFFVRNSVGFWSEVKSSALKTGNYGEINLDRPTGMVGLTRGGEVSVCHATIQTHVRVIVIDCP